MRPVPHLPRSVSRLTRLAAVFALLGLVSFAIGLLVPQPLPVIFSMSVGHGLGIVAVLLYFIAIVIDSRRSESQPVRKDEIEQLAADESSATPPRD